MILPVEKDIPMNLTKSAAKKEYIGVYIPTIKG